MVNPGCISHAEQQQTDDAESVRSNNNGNYGALDKPGR